MYVLIEDDRGGLALRRLQPWHRLAARGRAGRLDRELARGTSPEASASLAARAMMLTSMPFRRDLAASLRRIVLAVGEPPPFQHAASTLPAEARPPRIPLSEARISRSAGLLTELASRLVQRGPVPVAGVAMVSVLLADGTGPLYREAGRDDLGAIAERAAQALTW
jgi:hypothetical protein